MERGTLLFCLAVGFGLLVLIPLSEHLDDSLQAVAVFLLTGYWGMIGLYFLLLLLQRFFAEYRLSLLLYNIWLFASLMGIAVGVLAIIDEGVEKAPWAVVMVLYGTLIAILKRDEL